MCSSKKWYEQAFDEDYVERYAHRDKTEAALAVELLRGLALRRGANCLDLCCGAGRHLPFLAQLGLNVTGGDLSLPLLKEAEANHGALARLDMRALPFVDGAFQVVTNFFTAFGYFDRDEDNAAVIAEVARVLEPGGWFVLDFFNSHLVGKELGCGTGWKTVRRANGTLARVHRHLTPDKLRAEKQVEEASGLGYRESVRLYSREELERMMVTCGMTVVQRWGDYTGQAFAVEQSTRCIVVGRLPG
ncbi:class I SAM-dependent methyltransferase [Candidatus Sumerlaeota bacterium]|nr:class I SAM-dependent methyltransferase [Candidatus Sumerlaeota bacterium]